MILFALQLITFPPSKNRLHLHTFLHLLDRFHEIHPNRSWDEYADCIWWKFCSDCANFLYKSLKVTHPVAFDKVLID